MYLTFLMQIAQATKHITAYLTEINMAVFLDVRPQVTIGTELHDKVRVILHVAIIIGMCQIVALDLAGFELHDKTITQAFVHLGRNRPQFQQLEGAWLPRIVYHLINDTKSAFTQLLLNVLGIVLTMDNISTVKFTSIWNLIHIWYQLNSNRRLPRMMVSPFFNFILREAIT